MSASRPPSAAEPDRDADAYEHTRRHAQDQGAQDQGASPAPHHAEQYARRHEPEGGDRGAAGSDPPTHDDAHAQAGIEGRALMPKLQRAREASTAPGAASSSSGTSAGVRVSREPPRGEPFNISAAPTPSGGGEAWTAGRALGIEVAEAAAASSASWTSRAGRDGAKSKRFLVGRLCKGRPAYTSGKVKVGDKIVAIFSSDMDKPVYLHSEMSVEDVQRLLDHGPPYTRSPCPPPPCTT
jgi:hypothetical protein